MKLPEACIHCSWIQIPRHLGCLHNGITFADEISFDFSCFWYILSDQVLKTLHMHLKKGKLVTISDEYIITEKL